MELGKQTYRSTRRWLSNDHKTRSVEFIEHFNSEVESHPKPKAISLEEQLQHAARYKAWKAAGNISSVVSDPSKIHGVKGASILYRPPYWKVWRVGIYPTNVKLYNYSPICVITTLWHGPA
jgi:hypothetical protein